MISTDLRYSRLALTACVFCALLASVALAQLNESQARARAKSLAMAALHMEPGRFLDIQRREDLEQMLEEATGTAPGTVFLYRISRDGDEIQGSTVLYHRSTDGDSKGFVMVTAANGTVFRIKGFGLADSFSDFNRMLNDFKIRITNSVRAQSLAEFYLAINPENIENIEFGIVKSPLEVKQAVERECHAVGRDFESSENEFVRWWMSHKSTILNKDFDVRVSPSPGGFIVRFFTVAFPKQPECGGGLLESTLDVSEAGVIKPLSSKPAPK